MADALKYRVIKVDASQWVQALPASMVITLNLSNGLQVHETLPVASETFDPTNADNLKAALDALHTGGFDDTLAAF
jgi:ADP-ribosylglycohydrolase